jgi:hypothetical protein
MGKECGKTYIDILAVKGVDKLRGILRVLESDNKSGDSSHLGSDLADFTKSTQRVVQQCGDVLSHEARNDGATDLSHAMTRERVLVLFKKLNGS